MTVPDASLRKSSRTFGAVVEIVCLAVMTAAGLSAWLVGVVSKGYDYDEVLRAHSIWLTSQGLRPYSDFFEVHPPYFLLLSPVARAWADPIVAIRALRFLTALGNFGFLSGLVVLGARSLPEGTSRRWAWLAVAFVAFQPLILDDLVEFRIDGWGYAAIAWGTVRFRGHGASVRRAFEFGAGTALAVALCAPKVIFLPPLIAFFEIILGLPRWRPWLRAASAYLAGVGLAALVVLIYLLAQRIELDRTILLLGRYHAVSNAHAGFGFGLFERILTMRLLLGVTLAGLAAWSFGCVRRRRLTGPFEPAVAVWLLIHIVVVTYPYKQYYAPWFLFGSVFAPSLGPIFAVVLRRAQVLVYVLACVVSVLGAFSMARFWSATAGAATDNALIQWMNQVSRPEDRVVGSPPYHPIDRRDTFFLSFNTTDPGGFDSERICNELPGLRTFVTTEHYRGEFAAHPPAVVVLASPFFEVRYPEIQRRVLEEELRSRGYQVVRKRGVSFALRPDSYDRAARRGYLE